MITRLSTADGARLPYFCKLVRAHTVERILLRVCLWIFFTRYTLQPTNLHRCVIENQITFRQTAQGMSQGIQQALQISARSISLQMNPSGEHQQFSRARHRDVEDAVFFSGLAAPRLFIELDFVEIAEA